MADAPGSESVAQLFQLAIEQEVRVNLTFLMDLCQFSIITGQFAFFKNRHFGVRADLRQLREKQVIWGADVDGFFAVRTELDRQVVHFKSKLVRLYNAPPDSMYLIFPLPAYVDDAQRRHSRRVELGRESSASLQAWYGVMEGGDQVGLPQQVWKSLRENQCEIGELSPSGMRLDFQADNAISGQLLVDTPILLKGEFGPKSKQDQLFVLGTIVRRMSRKDKDGIMSVGCHFFRWRRIAGADSETWFKADPQDGIALISQWLRNPYRGISRPSQEEQKKNALTGGRSKRSR